MAETIGTHFSRLAGRVISQSSPPTDDVQTGDLWFDTDTNHLMAYDGTNWIGVGALTTSTSTSTSSTSTSTSTTA